jgi:hypothetical protein
MPYDSERFHRHSQRLPGHDYAGVATYFVTIVTEHREQWFGSIIQNTMHLNICGLMVDSLVWPLTTISFGGCCDAESPAWDHPNTELDDTKQERPERAAES